MTELLHVLLLLPFLGLLDLAQTQVLGVDLVLLRAVEHLVSADIKSKKEMISNAFNTFYLLLCGELLPTEVA